MRIGQYFYGGLSRGVQAEAIVEVLANDGRCSMVELRSAAAVEKIQRGKAAELGESFVAGGVMDCLAAAAPKADGGEDGCGRDQEDARDNRGDVAQRPGWRRQVFGVGDGPE